MVDVGLTKKCNNNCIMCTNLLPLPKNYADLTTKQILDKIKNLDKRIDSITLTGGEPTIRKDMFRILEYININFPKVRINLITNGRLLSYSNFIVRLIKINNLTIITEIHGPERIHDRITDSKGSYKQTVKGIKNCLDNDVKLELRIVVHRINYRHLPFIADSIIRNFRKVSSVVIFPIDIIGNAHKNKDEVFVSYSNMIPFVEKASSILMKNKINFLFYHFPLCILSEDYRIYSKNMTVDKKRVTFTDVCNHCRHKKKCSGIWKTYLINHGKKEFNSLT